MYRLVKTVLIDPQRKLHCREVAIGTMKWTLHLGLWGIACGKYLVEEGTILLI